MNRSKAVAWVLASVALVAMIVADVLGDPTGEPALGTVDSYLLLATFAAFPVIGALTVTRYSGNALGWVFIGTGLIVGLGVLGTSVAYAAYVEGRDIAFAVWGAWTADWYWYPGFGMTTAYLLLLFPDGKPVNPRWRKVSWLVALDLGALTFTSMLADRLRVGARFVRNPIGLLELSTVDAIRGPLFIGWGILLLLAVASLVIRFRRSRGEQRLQLKWLTFAATLFAVYAVAGILFDLPLTMFSALFLTLPVTVGIAILKYRLYDIDVVINRTLVYGLLTGILALTYLTIVVSLQAVFADVTEESDLAVAASTLAVAALFRPLRSRVQTFIDHRFYRRKYDATAMLGQFSSHLRDQVDLESLTRALVGVVGETMQPAHVSVWIRRREVSA